MWHIEEDYWIWDSSCGHTCAHTHGRTQEGRATGQAGQETHIFNPSPPLQLVAEDLCVKHFLKKIAAHTDKQIYACDGP